MAWTHYLLLALVAVWVAGAGPRSVGLPPTGRKTKVEEHSMTLPGRIWPERYRKHPGRYHGHHAVTYQGGSQAHKALIEVETPDREVAAFLAEQGASSGGGIPADAWLRLSHPGASEPDLRAEGSPVVVEVRAPGGPWFPLHALLADKGGRDLDLRFVDNRRWIETFGSGCVVCLSSCPGSKIANRAYTIRENQAGAMEFLPQPSPFSDGDVVEVRVRRKFSSQEEEDLFLEELEDLTPE